MALVQKVSKFLANAAHDTSLGLVNGVQAHAEFTGDVAGRVSFDRTAAKSRPGARREVPLDHLERPLQEHCAVVGLARLRTRLANRIGDLLQGIERGASAGRR